MSQPISRANRASLPASVAEGGPRALAKPKAGGSFAEALSSAEPKPEGPSMVSMLKGAAAGIAGGDAMMHRALGAMRSGRTLSNGELLALQAGVYRYTEELDLAGKLVDKATGSVKQTLQSQQ